MQTPTIQPLVLTPSSKQTHTKHDTLQTSPRGWASDAHCTPQAPWSHVAQVGACSADPGTASTIAVCCTIWPRVCIADPTVGTTLHVVLTPAGLCYMRLLLWNACHTWHSTWHLRHCHMQCLLQPVQESCCMWCFYPKPWIGELVSC